MRCLSRSKEREETVHRLTVLVAVLAVLVNIVACANQSTSSLPHSLPLAPTPRSGQAVAFGRVLSVITGKPIQRIRVAFAEVIRGEGNDAIFVDDGGLMTPWTETDEHGVFVLPDLTPKEYVVVIGDPMGVNDVIRDPSTNLPRIWKVEPDQQLDLGELKVNIDF
ncbi:MAG: carboxypeptidase regulatory-like domain-containing protein [Chloroflexi bacterium]|nr:MAG: carboxypeptidase regulatory-like domain-containing protein [Chloroflexota bacterium]